VLPKSRIEDEERLSLGAVVARAMSDVASRIGRRADNEESMGS
jgi:hypothetical protein